MAVLNYTEPVVKYGSTSLSQEDEGNMLGFITGIVILVALLGLFFYYLLPYVQNALTPPVVNQVEVSTQAQ